MTAGERLYMDISSIKGENYGGLKCWALVVDDYSGYCWIYFLNHKSDLKLKLLDLILELRDLKKTVKFLRLDDAGENFALEKACKQQQLGVTFEFSGPRTPQRNEKWKESSKPSMEKSEQCLMHRELMVRFDMDFGQNVHLQHLSMRTES